MYQEWLELDRLLTCLWESYSTRLKVLHDAPPWIDKQIGRSFMESLFPQLTVRGIVEIVLDE